MTQSIQGSVLEGVCNQLSGLFTANITWVYVIAPVWGFSVYRDDVLAINLIFATVSLIRGFLWRRLFNWIERGRECKT